MFRRLLLLNVALGVVTLAASTVQADEDLDGIRKASLEYAEAFNRGDVDAMIGSWTPDADYVDDLGSRFKGRDAIAKNIRENRKLLAGHRMKIQIDSVRLLQPGVGIEDGVVELIGPTRASEKSRYTAIHVKRDGKWLLASVRELPSPADESAGPYEQLKELEWLVGTWTSSDKLRDVTMECRWTENRSFLEMHYKIKLPIGNAMTATQRIGWDPVEGRVHSWAFDSLGGFGEGLWSRENNVWTVASNGVLPDGRTGTATYVWKFVNDDKYVWHAANRQVQGEAIPDLNITFVRAAAKKTEAPKESTAKK